MVIDCSVLYLVHFMSCFLYIFIEQPYKDATTGICMGRAYMRDNNTCAVIFIRTIGGELSRGGRICDIIR